METNKSPKANLEDKKTTFVLIGLVVVLALVYVALEWSTPNVNEKERTAIYYESAEEPVEILPITERKPVPKPPLPISQPQASSPANDPTQIDIVIDTDPQTGTITGTDPDAPIVNPPFTGIGDIIDIPDDSVYVFTPVAAAFPGDLMKWITKTIRYPVIAAENQVQGKVIVSFVIEKDGSISNVKIVKSVDPHLDKEAVRVVKAMPTWTPGKRDNKPVRAAYTMPIHFRLKDNYY